MSDEIQRASSRLYSTGTSEHVTIPKPLRPLLKWRKGEELIVLVESDTTIRVMTLDQHMRNVVNDDRRRRNENDNGSPQ